MVPARSPSGTHHGPAPGQRPRRGREVDTGRKCLGSRKVRNWAESLKLGGRETARAPLPGHPISDLRKGLCAGLAGGLEAPATAPASSYTPPPPALPLPIPIFHSSKFLPASGPLHLLFLIPDCSCELQ